MAEEKVIKCLRCGSFNFKITTPSTDVFNTQTNEVHKTSGEGGVGICCEKCGKIIPQHWAEIFRRYMEIVQST